MTAGRCWRRPTRPGGGSGTRRRRARLFTVGFMPGLIVTAAVREFSRRYPEVTVEVLRTDWLNQTDVIHDGTVDVGYLRLPVELRGLTTERC